MKFKETKRRSFVKATTFRVLVVVSDIVIVYVLTKRLDVTAAVTIFTNVASSVFYFLHERVWDGIDWGKLRVRNSKLSN
jgi:uncharacterized membrane protein